MPDAVAAQPIELTHRSDWLRTPEGAPRGYIQAQRLAEVWFHTGTICNLACPFCLEGSRPGDNRLGRVTLDDVVPFIDEAVELGVRQFSFTGGEPFVVRDVPAILDYALERGACLVLTNGTKPLQRRMDELEGLQNKPHPLSFRVSLDYPLPERHDAGRGAGSFALALESLGELHRRGFGVSVARQMDEGENGREVEERYRELLAGVGIEEPIRIVAFPDLLGPGETADVPLITEDCMTRYHTAESRASFMCASSRMVVKSEGRMRVYACTLVDDDPDYDLGGTLAESLRPRIRLKHHRCYACFAFGASCSELG
ncbi:MAG: radical SAM protein [Gemmatimonadota bacterium]